jgi:hypothetical protein
MECLAKVETDGGPKTGSGRTPFAAAIIHSVDYGFFLMGPPPGRRKSHSWGVPSASVATGRHLKKKVAYRSVTDHYSPISPIHMW